jgi:hypothetical protein
MIILSSFCVEGSSTAPLLEFDLLPRKWCGDVLLLPENRFALVLVKLFLFYLKISEFAELFFPASPQSLLVFNMCVFFWKK